MICVPCRAADHDGCANVYLNHSPRVGVDPSATDGTWCDCQHRDREPLAPDVRLCNAHDMNDHDAAFLARLPWRTGRRVGRTVYAQLGGDATDIDMLIGVMDSPELADEVCASHNAMLRPVDGGRR